MKAGINVNIISAKDQQRSSVIGIGRGAIFENVPRECPEPVIDPARFRIDDAIQFDMP